MAILASTSARRPLEPIDRVSEVLFGLIMVLSFTGSLSVADAGRDDVRAMLIGALGCNLAWGLIDAILYLMGCAAENGMNIAIYRNIRATTVPADAHLLIASALPPMVASVMRATELEAVRRRLMEFPEPPARVRLQRKDLLGAAAVFLLVFLSTFPVAIPFMLMHQTGPAMRVSNAVAIGLLFLTGFAFGKISGRNPWLVGCSMVVLGLVLVGLTIALGG